MPNPQSNPDVPPWLSRAADGSWLIRVKAVPGASRDAIAGPLGDRLKVRVAAPPEGGKANKAICKLIAAKASLKTAQIEIIAGASAAEKTVRVSGDAPAEAINRLNA